MFDLAHLVSRIDAIDDTARKQCAHVGPQPLPAILALDGDDVAAL